MGRSSERVDCCGTCKYRQRDNESKESVCGNVDSDTVGLVVDNSEFCFRWEAQQSEI